MPFTSYDSRPSSMIYSSQIPLYPIDENSKDQSQTINHQYVEMKSSRESELDTDECKNAPQSRFQFLRKTSVMLKSQRSRKLTEDSNDSTNSINW